MHAHTHTHTRTRPCAHARARTLAARESRQNILGGSCSLRPRRRETCADAPPFLKAPALWLCDRETSADAPPFLKVLFTHLRMRARTHMPRERASERGERERERERKRKRERARENVRTLFQVCPAHHIVSARQAYAHLPCFLRPGYPLPPRPSETLQRRPRPCL